MKGKEGSESSPRVEAGMVEDEAVGSDLGFLSERQTMSSELEFSVSSGTREGGGREGR